MAADIIVGLDVGNARVGVAVARSDVRIPQPLSWLDSGPDIIDKIRALLQDQHAVQLVVGWPRGLQGQPTEQTQSVEAFVERLRQAITIPISLQDEALTSKKAEAELRSRRKPYEKGEIDSLAATYILEDYLAGQEASYV